MAALFMISSIFYLLAMLCNLLVTFGCNCMQCLCCKCGSGKVIIVDALIHPVHTSGLTIFTNFYFHNHNEPFVTMFVYYFSLYWELCTSFYVSYSILC